MVPRKSEEEVRGSYIGLRRHHHLPAADVRCQIYFLLHTFVYVSHAIVNILYFTSTLPSRMPTWWRGVSDGTYAQDVRRQRVRRNWGRGQKTPHQHFRVRGPGVVGVSVRGPTEVGHQQLPEHPARPHGQLCQGLRVPLPRWEHRDLRVRTLGARAAAEHLPRRVDGAREVNNFQPSKLTSFKL